MSAVAVVGAGNAALCAAISAREHGADVHVFERAPFELRGGNSRFTGGAIRTTYTGIEELKALMPELTTEEIARTDFGSYSREAFLHDLGRLSQFRTDPELADFLVTNSYKTLMWMRNHGVRFLPSYGRQSFEIGGIQRFWGGLAVEAWGGGQGLVDSLSRIADQANVRIHYDSHVTGLEREPNQQLKIVVNGRRKVFDAVVLACGGFEASAEMRTQYLGPNWDLAKVRGTRFNTGDGIKMALAIGARSYGNWSGCHAVAWDFNAPEFGDLDVGDGFQKHSYPLGIIVNADGKRFVDEGADFRNYTYAKYGRAILEQPNQIAWQIFDQQTLPLLRDEYRIPRVSRVKADSLQALARKLDGIDESSFIQTIEEFNRAIDTSVTFNPSSKDGRGTRGLAIPKSNWANPIELPPYEAYSVTCGITFTFGGLRVDRLAHVLDEHEKPIRGLYAAGELVGGLFYFNYPGGSGLTAGSVFGRQAGYSAAHMSQSPA